MAFEAIPAHGEMKEPLPCSGSDLVWFRFWQSCSGIWFKVVHLQAVAFGNIEFHTLICIHLRID